MDSRDEIRDFLSSRRARITPEEAGLPAFGANRRVPGLRREEVAMLAGLSVDYYIRLERGDARGASDEVLDGIARALRLDAAERTHLYDLIRAAEAPAARQEQVRPAVRQIVDAMSGIPAMVRNRRLDILHANQLGHALYSEVYANPVRPANPARYVFLDGASSTVFSDNWSRAADDMVALLRAEAGRNPADQSLMELIAELSTGSDEFRSRWAAHDVLLNRTGVARFHHAAVGDLTLAYEDLVLPEDPGQTILVFTAEPGSESADALKRLATWAADHPPNRHEDETENRPDPNPPTPGT